MSSISAFVVLSLQPPRRTTSDNARSAPTASPRVNSITPTSLRARIREASSSYNSNARHTEGIASGGVPIARRVLICQDRPELPLGPREVAAAQDRVGPTDAAEQRRIAISRRARHLAGFRVRGFGLVEPIELAVYAREPQPGRDRVLGRQAARHHHEQRGQDVDRFLQAQLLLEEVRIRE